MHDNSPEALPEVATPTPDTPELPATFARRNDRGLIEVVCLHTGRVLAVQASEYDLLESKRDRLTRIDTPQGPVWIEKSINFDIINHIKQIPYSKVLADLITEEIVQGSTLVKACQKLNLPYSTVKRWENQNEEFKLAIKQAKQDRADYLHDEVVDEAREKADTKTKIASLQWAAEKGNPEKYGTKTKIVGDQNAPIAFIIDTGIRRPGDPGYVAPKEFGPMQAQTGPLRAEESEREAEALPEIGPKPNE